MEERRRRVRGLELRERRARIDLAPSALATAAVSRTQPISAARHTGSARIAPSG